MPSNGVPAIQPWSQWIADVERLHLADQPGAHRLAHPGEVRRPAAVLVDREPHALRVGEVAEPLAGVEVEDERLLRQHVLAGRERRLDHRQPLGRVRRDVDDRDVVARERAGDVVGRLGAGKNSSRRASALASVRLQITATSKPAAR